MDFQSDLIIRSARSLLTSNDVPILRETVDKLVERCVSSLESEEAGDIKRDIYLRLAKESAKLDNIHLAVIAVEGLKSKQLSEIVRRAVAKPDRDRSIAISLVNNHIQDSDVDVTQEMDTATSDQIDFETIHILSSNIYDPEKVANKYKPKHDELIKRVICSTLASHHETSENFNDALINYENASIQNENLPRTTMKHLICSTHQALEQYCTTSQELQCFWIKYLITLRVYSEAVGFWNRSRSSSHRTQYMLIQQASEEEQADLLDSRISSLLKDFINNKEASKWLDRKKTHLIADSVISLNLSTRVLLAEILCRNIRTNSMPHSCCIAFCLGFRSKFVDLAEIEHNNIIEIMSLQGPLLDLTHFADIIVFQSFKHKRVYKKQRNQILFDVCLKLGLIDLALRNSCINPQQARYIHQLPIYIENDLKGTDQNLMEATNPYFRNTTLKLIDVSLTQSEDKDLATNVITTVIFSLTIILTKLDIDNRRHIDYSLPILENTFGYLKRYLDDYTFHLSDMLIRATNGLTLAIKNNLDALSDSEIMRESFRKLIESIAGRCMLEGRYKSSAMLYSNIEDNVNAIKSLMRTGEVDTVINYALLVKDFTVNRIAINYLKHLRVDPKTVEDFVARSQC